MCGNIYGKKELHGLQLIVLELYTGMQQANAALQIQSEQR